MEEIREKYGEKVTFIILYQREAHPNQRMGSAYDYSDIDQPENYEERHVLAQRTCDDLHPATLIVIDDMENSVRKAYGGLPNSAFIIDKGGIVVQKENWADIGAWPAILDRLLDGKDH